MRIWVEKCRSVLEGGPILDWIPVELSGWRECVGIWSKDRRSHFWNGFRYLHCFVFCLKDRVDSFTVSCKATQLESYYFELVLNLLI